jgi:hypothetical protein
MIVAATIMPAYSMLVAWLFYTIGSWEGEATILLHSCMQAAG